MATIDELIAQSRGAEAKAAPPEPQRAISLTSGPVTIPEEVATLLRPRPSSGEPSKIRSIAEMPSGFRFNLMMRRGDPEALQSYMKEKGFAIDEYDPQGKLIVRDKVGNRYDMNASVPEEYLRTPETAMEVGGAVGGAYLGHPHLGSVAGSLASDAYENLLRTIAGTPLRSKEEIAKKAGISLLLSKGTDLAGRGIAALSGKTALQREGTAAAEEALGKITAKRTAATERASELGIEAEASALGQAQTAQAGFNQAQAKAVEDAYKAVRSDVTRREMAEMFGVDEKTISRAMPATTLAEMTERVRPLQTNIRASVARNFEDLSTQFDEVLAPHSDLAVTPTFIEDSARSLRQDIIGDKVISGPMAKLLDRAETLGGAATELPPQVARNVERLRASGDVDGANNILRMHGGDPSGVDVRKVLDYRTDLQKHYRSSKSSLERSVSRRMIEAIDENLGGVIPEDAALRLADLRANWGMASNLFDQTYREGFRKAQNPAELARVIYEGSTGKGKVATNQIGLIVNDLRKNAPDQLPEFRFAYADRVLSDDNPRKVIQGMNDQVVNLVFDIPKPRLMEILDSRVNMEAVTKNPQDLARFNTYFQKGMSSLGAEKKKAALAAAEDNLARLPDARTAMQTAMQEKAVRGLEAPEAAFERAGREAMKRPFFGGWQKYMEHRALSHAALSSVAFASTHSILATTVPLIYLGGSRAVSYLLSKPKIADAYYHALTSKTVERRGYYLGRVAVGLLSDAARPED